MNMINLDEVKWIEDDLNDVKKLTAKVNEAVTAEPVKKEEKEAPKSALSKMKAFVRKAVDCCIE